MAVLKILEYPDPRLRIKAKPVETVTDDIRQLAADMLETMYAAPGVGLAATQVDRHVRLVVMDVSENQDQPLILINPEILSREGTATGDEGCLSVPGESFPLRRGEAATLTGLALDGTEIRYEATGWFARMLQHEYDHLNGFLYVDRLTGKWSRKARKAVKGYGWGVPGLSWMPGEDRDPFGHDDETPEDERSD